MENRPFYSNCKMAYSPNPPAVMDGSKAGVDLVLIQTFLPVYVNQVILNLMLTSIFQGQFP